MDAPRTEAMANGQFYLAGELFRFDLSFASLAATPFGQRFETGTVDEICTDIAPVIEDSRAFVEQAFGLIQHCRGGRWVAADLSGEGELGIALQRLQPGEFTVIRTAFCCGLSAFFSERPLWAGAGSTQDAGLIVAAAIESTLESAQVAVVRALTAAKSTVRTEIEPHLVEMERAIHSMASPLATPPEDTPPSRRSMITGE